MNDRATGTGTAPTAARAAGVRPGGLVDAIDALLPQTQCTKCGFEGCRPYAEAIASGEAAIDCCPPGGAAGIAALARLLDRPILPLNPACGVESPRLVAWIDPALCIGCTKCIQACPVDAIVGARRRMHTVATPLCTGCDLCAAPCPVDCIVMRPPPPALAGWSDDDAAAARLRHQARGQRLARLRRQRQQRLAAHGSAEATAQGSAEARKRQMIEAAMHRARERLAGRQP